MEQRIHWIGYTILDGSPTAPAESIVRLDFCFTISPELKQHNSDFEFDRSVRGRNLAAASLLYFKLDK